MNSYKNSVNHKSTLTQDLLDSIDALPGAIEEQIQNLFKQRDQLIQEITELEELGIVQATPHYREGEYLYLIHPTQPDGSRKREYIGNKPHNIKVALDRVERFNQHSRKCRELQEVESKIKYIDRELRSLINRTKQSGTRGYIW